MTEDLYPPEFGPRDSHQDSAEQLALEKRVIVFRRSALLLAATAAFLAIAVLVVGVVLIRNTQTQNTPLIRNTEDTLERIQDCTSPGRACYERGQEQLGQAIADINQVAIAAAACAVGLSVEIPPEQRVAQIAACTTEQLTKTRDKRNARSPE